jgi:hypothetical protein
MYKIILLLLLSNLLFAKNPFIYSALGDNIYNNVKNIEKLKEIESYKPYIKDIEKYLQDVKKTKEYGYKIQKHQSQRDKSRYLQKLRDLSKKNDFFVRSVEKKFKSSIQNNNYKLFSNIVSSQLLDDTYESEIMEYYLKNSQKIETNNRIEKYLDKNKKVLSKKEVKEKRLKLKQDRELEKIKRIREADKAQQEALEKRLEEEIKKQKSKIMEEQINSLI